MSLKKITTVSLFVLSIVGAINTAQARIIPMPKYTFEAQIQGSEITDIGRGGATGMAPLKRYVATVTSVQRGKLRKGQRVYIETVAGQSSLDLAGICKFNAPNKHPAFAKGTLILDAMANGCRAVSKPPIKPLPQPIPAVTYNFEGLVTNNHVADIGRGGATGMAPVKRLKVTVSRVKTGTLRSGQTVEVEVVPSQSSINFNGYCRFESPNKHPAYNGTLLLDTKITGCRNRL